MRYDSALNRRVVLVIACAAALWTSNICLAEEAEFRLRMAWGGGEPVVWKGNISLTADVPSAGSIENVSPIGREPDTVRSFFNEPLGVRIECPTARTYEAVDLRIRAPASANLNVSIGDGSRAPLVVSIPVSKLITGRHVERIDEQGNQLTVERAPGDRLRVDIQREHLVFAPGDAWAVRVDPHLLGTSFSSSASLQARLFVARSHDQLWDDQQQLTIDASGEIQGSTVVDVPIPDEEGVYDLELAIVRPRPRALISSTEEVVRRRVQFVVVSDTEPKTDGGGWRDSPEYEFDPAQPRLFSRLATVAPRRGLPAGLTPGLTRSLGSRDTQIVEDDETTWVELAGEGWQAYALSLSNPGEPHVLELEYPGDRTQRLGVSLLEPNAAGNVVPVGIDGMIHVESPTKGRQRYRLIFWPKTKQPYLVLTNRRKSKPAAYGVFRVFRRDGRLPAISIDEPPVGAASLKTASLKTAPLKTAPLGATSLGTASNRRFAVARFSRPVFSKVFGAADSTDDETGQALDDWVTFYDGTRRLIEYVRYLGYDAISITGLCEGSAIFPAEGMRLNPKYDTGIYFSNGQDPVRKDVLELMFRLCDRNGLKLIPAMELTTPMESLETQMESDSANSEGIQLADSSSTPQGSLGTQTVYNPLDLRVQSALGRFFEQTTRRYARHSSFGGLGLTLSAGTPTHLPRVDSACDRTTVSRFAVEAGLPSLQSTGVADHVRMLSDSSYGELWSRWRSHQLRMLYQSMARAVRAGPIDAKLYLALDDLVSEPAFSSALAPGLPNSNSLSKALMAVGINPETFADNDDFVLLRPHRFDLLASVAEQGALQQLNKPASEGGRNRLWRGSSFYHVPQPLRLPELDAQIPFGKDDNFALFAPQAIPAGPASRRHLIQSLALNDTSVWFDGGWTAVRDQHDWLAPVIDIFRRLPAEKFETADPSVKLGARLAVRKLSRDGVTYAYAVNNSPWPLAVRIQLGMPPASELKALSPYKRPGELRIESDGAWWEFTLGPYDIVAGVLTHSDVTIGRTLVELPTDVMPTLRNRIVDLSTRISVLAQPGEMRLSENPSFELRGEDGEGLAGWLSTQDSDVQVQVVANARSGNSSLRITNRAPVAWLRSTQFATSNTGRMLFRIWARPNVGAAPRLRLLAESTTLGQVFTRQVELVMPPESANEWRPYDLRIDDLPVSVKDMRVGVDVLGSGTVWLDDAQAFDLAFSRRERNELSKIIALADLQLREGRAGDCQTSLDQYWMQYLRSYVSPDDSRIARAPKTRTRNSQEAPAVLELPKTGSSGTGSSGKVSSGVEDVQQGPSDGGKPASSVVSPNTSSPKATAPRTTAPRTSSPRTSSPRTSSAFEKLRGLVPGFRR